MPQPTNLTIFLRPSSGSLEIIVKSPRECEKWILYKISHRSSGPKKNSTQIFSMKKIILKMKIFDFFRTFFFIKAKNIFLWKMKIFKIFIFQRKIFFAFMKKNNFWKIEILKKINFQNYFFRRKKYFWYFFWISILM